MSKKTIVNNALDNVAVALTNVKKGGEAHENVTLAEDIAKGNSPCAILKRAKI